MHTRNDWHYFSTFYIWIRNDVYWREIKFKRMWEAYILRKDYPTEVFYAVSLGAEYHGVLKKTIGDAVNLCIPWSLDTSTMFSVFYIPGPFSMMRCRVTNSVLYFKGVFYWYYKFVPLLSVGAHLFLFLLIAFLCFVLTNIIFEIATILQEIDLLNQVIILCDKLRKEQIQATLMAN